MFILELSKFANIISSKINGFLIRLLQILRWRAWAVGLIVASYWVFGVNWFNEGKKVLNSQYIPVP